MVARTIRLPERLYERLRARAKAHYRTTNAEVIEAIRVYLETVKAESGEKRADR